MNNNEFAIEEFLKFCDDTIYKLRLNGDIEQREMEKLIKLLRKVGTIYSGSDAIPKSIASILFDLSTALYSAVDFKSKEKKEKLFLLFDLFCDVAREVLNQCREPNSQE
ncbi:hypothetical protein ACIGHN_27025 [Acidovorax sp. NPDC077693]|uniref:hypothetical protein n=1 Tax=unclassified Acidovorax TaxID=2684926 RepID=UPI0037CBE401